MTPGTEPAPSAPGFARSTLHQRVVQGRTECFGVAAEIRDGDHHHERGENGGPDDQPAGRIPFERGAGAARCRRPRQHGEIAEPPRRNTGTGKKGEKEHRAEYRSKADGAGSAASSAAQWLQPSAAIRIGSGAR